MPIEIEWKEQQSAVQQVSAHNWPWNWNWNLKVKGQCHVVNFGLIIRADPEFVKIDTKISFYLLWNRRYEHRPIRFWHQRQTRKKFPPGNNFLKQKRLCSTVTYKWRCRSFYSKLLRAKMLCYMQSSLSIYHIDVINSTTSGQRISAEKKSLLADRCSLWLRIIYSLEKIANSRTRCHRAHR